MIVCSKRGASGQEKMQHHQHQNSCNTKKKVLRGINFIKITKNIFQRWSRIWPLLFGFCAISKRLPEERMGVTKKIGAATNSRKHYKKIQIKKREGNYFVIISARMVHQRFTLSNWRHPLSLTLPMSNHRVALLSAILVETGPRESRGEDQKTVNTSEAGWIWLAKPPRP